jgi:hypothetical protein
MIGRQVELEVPIRQHVNDIAFWASFEDHPLLVVLSRDTRDGRMRQAGEPPTRFLEIPDNIDTAVVSGKIERIPHAEAMFSWGLTNHDVDQLFDRPVYLRVDRVTPAQPAGTAY